MIQGTEQQDIPLHNARLTRYPVRIIAAVILSAVALGSVARFDQHTGLVLPKDQVQIATVGRGDLVRDIAVQGKLVAANAPTLFSQAEGVVSFIKQPGEAVNIGELLAVIESPELTGEVKRQTLLLASMTADLERAQLNAREQRLDIEQLRDTAAINRHAAKRDLLRAESSITKGVISRVDYEIIKDNCAKAEMEYAHVEQKLELVIDKLKFEHSATEQAVARQQSLVSELETRLASLQIVAPVTGQVGNWLVAQQSRVASGSGLLTVIDLGQYEAEIFIPENYARDLTPGLAVEMTLNGTMLMGKLSHIAPEVHAGGISARVSFDQTEASTLRQSQRLSARILLEEKNDVLRVARGDFVSSGGGHSLYRLEKNIAVRVPVQLGALSAQWVEIVKGVHEGDQIIVSNVQVFKDADRVRLN